MNFFIPRPITRKTKTYPSSQYIRRKVLEFFCLLREYSICDERQTPAVHTEQMVLNNLTFLFLSTSPAHKYYLAMDPVSESLYLSDTNTRKVYKLKSLVETKDLSKNFEVVAGTGDQCLPFDQSHCGDGGRASEASLNSPRGKKKKKSFGHLNISCDFSES